MEEKKIDPKSDSSMFEFYMYFMMYIFLLYNIYFVMFIFIYFMIYIYIFFRYKFLSNSKVFIFISG